MPCILLHQTWQIYWQIYLPSIDHRCLENYYTKLGRFTLYQSSIDALNTIIPNLADLLADLAPIKHRGLEYHYTKLGRSTGCLAYCYTKLGRSTPRIEHRSLEYHYTKHGRCTGRSTLPSSIDALHIITPNMADLPPPIKHRCLEYHYATLGRSTGRSTPPCF